MYTAKTIHVFIAGLPVSDLVKTVDECFEMCVDINILS